VQQFDADTLKKARDVIFDPDLSDNDSDDSYTGFFGPFMSSNISPASEAAIYTLVSRITSARLPQELTDKIFAELLAIARPTGPQTRTILSIRQVGDSFEYPLLRPYHMQCADAIILAYDVTSRASFEKFRGYYQEVENVVGRMPKLYVPMVVVATKVDLEQKRVVSRAEGEALARMLRLQYFETSVEATASVVRVFSAVGTTLALDRAELERPQTPKERPVKSGSVSSMAGKAPDKKRSSQRKFSVPGLSFLRRKSSV